MATRTLISYSHDSEVHRETVLRFAERLRQAGVDAWIDQYDEHNPPESWPDWMRREIEKSDVVIVVVTQNYVQRFNRETGTGVGSGVRWEGALITADLYHSRRERAKFIPVVLRPDDAPLIPSPLNLTSRFIIGESADADITRLVQVLLRNPGKIPGNLGIPNPSSGTSFHFEGVNPSPEVDSAFTEALKGNNRVAIDQLDALLQQLHGDERAYALFLQGVIHHKIGEVTQAKACFERVVETTAHPGLLESSIQRMHVVITELQAYFGDGGPVTAATNWLTSLKRGKKREVWKALTRELRLTLAQDWILANEDHPNVALYNRDELAKDLATKNPTHPLGKYLLRSKLEVLQDHYRRWEAKSWGAAGNPRRIGLDYELVVIAPADEGILVAKEGELLSIYPVLMQKIGPDWMIANFTAAYPIPGWPPQAEQIPAPMVQFARWVHKTEEKDSPTEGE